MEWFITAAFIIPSIMFVLFVAPIWVIMHYKAKTRMQQSLSEDERQEISELKHLAQQMSKRVETLEKILDVETPGWRDKL